MNNKLCPVGYIRGGGSSVSQMEHFDDVCPYLVTVNEFLSWLGAEHGLSLTCLSSDVVPPPLHKLLHEYFEIDQEKLKQERRIQEAHRQRAEQKYERCVNCKQALTFSEDAVWLPKVMVLATANYFGGYVCSEACDARLCLDTLAEMSDFDQLTHIDKARERVESNWK